MTEKEAEFVDILNWNKGIIYKICTLYRKSREDKEDLFQEIIYQLWRSYSKFENKSKISTWLYKVALNTAISAFRKEKSKPSIQELTDHHLNIPDIEDEGAEDVIELYNAISKLNSFDKSIILLHLDGFSNTEIAGIVNFSSNNINVKIFRIKSKIKELFSSNEE